MNKIFKVLQEYDRFYLCTNGIYRECFYKDEYKPIHNIIYKKDYYFIIKPWYNENRGGEYSWQTWLIY